MIIASTETEFRIEQLYRFLNMTAKSGHVNNKGVITEIAKLLNLNTDDVIVSSEAV